MLVAINVAWIAGLFAFCWSHNVSTGGFALTSLGTTLRDWGFQRAAIAFYSAALHFVPKASRVHGARAYSYFQAGAFEDAVGGYAHVMELEGISALRLSQRAAASYAASRFREALADYNSMVAINPFDPNSYVGRASVNMRLNAYNLAIENYSPAIDLEPTEMAHVYDRARTHIEAKHFDYAYADLIAIIQRDPHNYWATPAMTLLDSVNQHFRIDTPSRRPHDKAPSSSQIAL